MSRVILVRHCESESNAAGHAMGQGDAPLSARGREQALAVEAMFRGLAVGGARLVTSPMRRAVSTGEAIARATGLQATTDERLSAGESIGARMDMKAPETLRIIGEEVLGALTQHAAAPLIVVSHRYPIWALMTRLLGNEGTMIVDALGNGDRLTFELADGAIVGGVRHEALP